MNVLVAFSSKYGSTAQIAKYLADRLTDSGLLARSQSIDTIGEIGDADAYVIGSATYAGSWMKEAAAFVRRNQATLAGKPVWLFSSGPLGKDRLDHKGHDKLEATVPREIVEFEETLRPRSHRVFFGALKPSALDAAERLIRTVPAARRRLEAGDFRDWDDIASWAGGIAAVLHAERAAPVEP